MLTWVLHPLRYTRIQALSPAMGAALYVLQLTSRTVPNTTELTVAFRTWLCDGGSFLQCYKMKL